MRVLFASMALALTCTAPAAAQSVNDSFSVAVGYGDLNLNNPAAVATLKGRIKAKAEQACDVTPIDLGQLFDVRTCRAAFIRSAERNLELATAGVSGGTVLAAR